MIIMEGNFQCNETVQGHGQNGPVLGERGAGVNENYCAARKAQRREQWLCHSHMGYNSLEGMGDEEEEEFQGQEMDEKVACRTVVYGWTVAVEERSDEEQDEKETAAKAYDHAQDAPTVDGGELDSAKWCG